MYFTFSSTNSVSVPTLHTTLARTRFITRVSVHVTSSAWHLKLFGEHFLDETCVVSCMENYMFIGWRILLVFFSIRHMLLALGASELHWTLGRVRMAFSVGDKERNGVMKCVINLGEYILPDSLLLAQRLFLLYSASKSWLTWRTKFLSNRAVRCKNNLSLTSSTLVSTLQKCIALGCNLGFKLSFE